MEANLKVLLLLTAFLQFRSTTGQLKYKCSISIQDPMFFIDPTCDQSYFCENYGTEFSPEMKKCILPQGVPCDNSPKMFSCGENSICTERRFCYCDLDFLESQTGKCERARSHLENCQGDTNAINETCASQKRLFCQDGRCDCSDTSFWNIEGSVCVENRCESRYRDTFEDKESGLCHLELRQKDYNYFSYNPTTMKQNLISCPKNSSFHTSDTSKNFGACLCDKNFITSGDRTKCLATETHGGKCGPRTPGLYCNRDAGLECQRGICMCESSAIWNPTDSLCYSDRDCNWRFRGSFFYANQHTCQYLIESGCKSDDGPTCPENSLCVSQNADDLWRTSESARCQCNAGFTSSENKRMCLKTKYYGETCSKEDGDPCSPNSKLTCGKNGICGCKNNEMWSTVDQRCGLKQFEDCEISTSSCYRHSSCQFYSRYSNRCLCREGYTEKDSKCLGNYLSKCDVDLDCHAGTICNDGSCKCRNPLTQVFDENLKQCVNEASTSCVGKERCIKDSSCVGGICKCNAGFHESPTGRCAELLDHGHNCTGGKCDFRKALSCISGECTCFDESLSFVEGKGCVAEVGQNCGLLEPVGDCSGDFSKQCEFYMVNCEKSSYCQHIGKGASRCELLSAPSTGQ